MKVDELIKLRRNEAMITMFGFDGVCFAIDTDDPHHDAASVFIQSATTQVRCFLTSDQMRDLRDQLSEALKPLSEAAGAKPPKDSPTVLPAGNPAASD